MRHFRLFVVCFVKSWFIKCELFNVSFHWGNVQGFSSYYHHYYFYTYYYAWVLQASELGLHVAHELKWV